MSPGGVVSAPPIEEPLWVHEAVDAVGGVDEVLPARVVGVDPVLPPACVVAVPVAAGLAPEEQPTANAQHAAIDSHLPMAGPL